MKRSLYAAMLTALLSPVVLVVHAGAVTTNARLDVYPIDCVFEQVNNGVGQITFLTPAECGQEITITNPAPDTQSLAPISLSTPTKTPKKDQAFIVAAPIVNTGSVAVLLSQMTIAFTTAWMTVVPWMALSASGGGLSLVLAFDPRSIAPSSVFRFVLDIFFKR